MNMRVATGDGFGPGFARFWKRSYASDYVGIMILLLAYMAVQFFMEPFHRMFFLDNLAIQYPHAEIERVSVPWLFLYTLALPLLSLLLWILLTRPPPHKSHTTLLGLPIALLLSSFLTNIIKNSVGRPRPDLIARCKPAPGTPSNTLVSWTVCTETDHHTLHDGWRSFPSGHSSFAFSGLGYLSLVLAGQFKVFRPRTDFAKVLLTLVPLIGAALIAISRCEDYRHDVYDVTVGSLLGFFVAHFSYRRYYPSLRSSRCDTPYPPPGQEEEEGKKVGGRGSGSGSGSGRDEEEMVEGARQFEIGDEESDVELEPLTAGGARS
ncbi:PAP2-domain-containing protein [Tothia fuscella]|uniref:PAP2-domain-containing protein n=1 Tax=Tothia fuscella TaxID=1048955 RepID=A0A9P4NNT1_9PEZI|nr:PAP2-domain-containing protein [Tothia fuscella]